MYIFLSDHYNRDIPKQNKARSQYSQTDNIYKNTHHWEHC